MKEVGWRLDTICEGGGVRYGMGWDGMDWDDESYV